MKLVKQNLFVLLVVIITSANYSWAEEIRSSVDGSIISKTRQTPFSLYLTPSDAHRALLNSPSIVLIDVRTLAEVSFVGHPKSMDSNIPFQTLSTKFNSKNGTYRMVQNVNFVSDVDALMKRLGFTKSDPIILTCRSGARSAVAARLLHAAGYKKVWNQIEGFEGSIDNKTSARSKNGWRNAGLPWAYKIQSGAEWKPSTN